MADAPQQPDDPLAFIKDCVKEGRILGHTGSDAIHVLFATDVAETNVRVITAYRPNAREWEPDLRKRRAP